ncbi:MAG: DNA-directed DNA polymerase [Nanoarchaeota archaeon]|nr:DNA-directed DNA polymerase [Nanoarchaeota archaeon]MBU2520509.1 DNA-directed DNA polymerase [Nanoarchaeota archaeon]
MIEADNSKGQLVCIIDADYVLSDKEPLIRLWGKTKSGRSVLILDRTFDPYFYVLPKPSADLDKLVEAIKAMEIEGSKPTRVEIVKKNLYGKEYDFIQVFSNNPTDIPKFRDTVKHFDGVKEEYEYTIPFYRRYIINKGIVPMSWVRVFGKEIKTNADMDLSIEAEKIESIKEEEISEYPSLHILAFDIETSQAEGDEIIMISMMDTKDFKKIITYGNKASNVETVANEEEMIKRFFQLVKEQNPDMIVGYNTDRFDFQKIAEKCEKYKIPIILGKDDSHMIFRRRGRVSAARFRGRMHIDVYDFIENILEDSLSTEVLSLDRVARELLGLKKEKLSWKEIEELWKKGDIKTLGEYCLHDSLLTLKLAKNLLPQIFELSRVVGQTPFDASRMSYSQLVEWLLIRAAFNSNEIAPNRPKYDEMMRRRRAEPYTGGYVIEPKEGIHEHLALFDFQSLYPSITITHNISPEMVDCNCCEVETKVPDYEHHFCTEKRGFIPIVLENLVRRRIDIQKKMKKLEPKTMEYKRFNSRQYALKILANASYGYYGYPGSRWYSRVCAKSITAWGRYYIKNVMEFAKKLNYEVIYGDTDSLFIKIKTKKAAKEFLDKANAMLPGVMELDFKGFYKSGIFVLAKSGVAAKKRYALIDEEGNLTIRGFERVRRDWSKIAKDTQEKVLLAVLKEESIQKAVLITKRTINKLKSGKVKMDDLVIYTRLTKSLSQYEQVGPHVAAARKMKERGITVKEGYIIGYIITKGTGSISSRAEPVSDAKDYDPDYYIHNQVLPAALRVLQGLGVTEEKILHSSGEQSDLTMFKKK